jgi:hypothetical protein
VQRKVEHHAPFGVFVDIGEPFVKGLIKIPDFLDEGEMSEEMYPEVGTSVGAIVVGYNESNLSVAVMAMHRVFMTKPFFSLSIMTAQRKLGGANSKMCIHSQVLL